MAKRRKLEAPSVEDLNRIEAEFRRETPAGPGAAPIAQVASESAMNMQVMPPEMREKMAKLDRLQTAESRGLVAREIPLEQIDATALTRDRVALDPDEFKELKASIVLNGLRMPIEVYEIEPGKFGLISGYRRFLAVSELRGQPGQAPGVIEAFVREPKSGAQQMEAMVEENEVRSSLSHYERGRISVLAAQNGFYESVEDAVSKLFRFASKAKRSKVRSFATVFEELGDVLSHPQGLTEKRGLALAGVIKAGQGPTLREVLSRSVSENVEEEGIAIDEAVKGFAAKPEKEARETPDSSEDYRHKEKTESGVMLSWGRKGRVLELRLEGDLPDEILENLVEQVRNAL